MLDQRKYKKVFKAEKLKAVTKIVKLM